MIRVPKARIYQLGHLLNEIDENELTSRQINLYNIYTAYFSTTTQQFLTLISAVQYRFRLPIATFVNSNEIQEMQFFKKNTHYVIYSQNMNKNIKNMTKPLSSSSTKTINNILNDNDLDLEFDQMRDEEYIEQNDEDYSEYYGPTMQRQMASSAYTNNFTYNSYMIWNKLFHPFTMFPSLPFDNQQQITQSNYFNILNDFAVEIEAKDGSRDDDELVKFSEYIELTNGTLGGGDGKFFNHILGGNFKEEQFTIVILAFKRETLMSSLIESYLKLAYLHSILIVWNDMEIQQPSFEFIQKFRPHIMSKRIRVMKTNRNSLNNRFIPFDTIETDAVLSLDDDVSLRADEILFAFRFV